MNNRHTAFFASCLGLTTLVGCNGTFAPPVQGIHAAGATGVSGNQGMLRGAVGSHGRGAVGLGIGVSDSLRLEAAGDFANEWGMGSAGVRLTQRSADQRGAVDFEVGGGAGVGGMRCGNNADTTVTCNAGNSDGRTAAQRFAFGGYAGIGAGFRLHRRVELYARTRVQRTGSENIPATWWVSGIGGVDVLLGPINFNVGIGYGHYFNSVENDGDVILELGATLPLNALSIR